MDADDEEILNQIRLRHEEDNLNLPKKDRKPWELTEARKLQFERCKEARMKNIAARKELKKNEEKVKSDTITTSKAPDKSIHPSEIKVIEEPTNEDSSKVESKKEDIRSDIGLKTKKRKVFFREESSDESEVEYVMRKPKSKKRIVYIKHNEKHYSSDDSSSSESRGSSKRRRGSKNRKSERRESGQNEDIQSSSNKEVQPQLSNSQSVTKPKPPLLFV